MDGLLVGRDAECAALRSRLSVSRAGPVPVVLVTGEAGAGKTTLVEHVLASTSPQVLRGRAATWACPA
jgi:predicted ATPase